MKIRVFGIIRNLGTYTEINRKFGNFNILLFIFFSVLTIFNYITLMIMRYYDFNLKYIGKPLYRIYYSPLLFLKVRNDVLLFEKIQRGLMFIYLFIMVAIVIIMFISLGNKQGLLGSGRFSTLREIADKGVISLGDNLKDGVILGRVPFEYSVRSFLFVMNFFLVSGNISYIYNPNLQTVLFHSVIGFFIGIIFLVIGEKKITIIDDTNLHISLIAQTRGGKGAGVIIPTALNWKESILAFDIKKEIYDFTWKFRKYILKNRILLFQPYDESYKDENKVHYNPLSEIRLGTKREYDDINVIAEILTAPKQASEKNHWTDSAKHLLAGAILHLCYKKKLKGEEATLGQVYDFLTTGDVQMMIAGTGSDYHGTKAEFSQIYDETQLADIPDNVHPLVFRWANAIGNKRGDEFSDILSTTLDTMSLFMSPLVREATSKSDFKMRDIMNGKNPTSLYLVIPQEQIAVGGVLIKLLVSSFIARNMPEEVAKENNKYKCLAILDELPLFGYIPEIERGSGFVAGAKIKLLVVGQTINQFFKIYGKENFLLDNLAQSVFYSATSTDTETAGKVSKILGNKTIEYSNFSGGQGFFKGRYNQNTSKREVMTPDEIINMPEDRNLIMLNGDLRTIYGKKIRYYKERYFISKTSEKIKISKEKKYG